MISIIGGVFELPFYVDTVNPAGNKAVVGGYGIIAAAV